MVLLKTKSDFIVTSVEIGLQRWMLVVKVVSVDAYPFLAFSGQTYHLEDTGVDYFWLHCATSNLEVATKRLLHQQLKVLW